MNIGLYQSASALSALERWQDAVTQNITSSNVVGYKKRTVDFSVQRAGELQTDPRSRVGDGRGLSSLFPVASYGISFSQGENQPTRSPTDFAIQGDGFFQVQMPDGRRGYSRAGDMRVNAERMLLSSQGFPVLTADGNPVQLLPGGAPLVVNHEGVMTQGGTPIGRLGVVKFADTKFLQPLSAGLYVAPEGVEAVPVERPEVYQGYLESANISPLREMVDLVNIARAYEMNQRLISSRDQTMQKTLDTLG